MFGLRIPWRVEIKKAPKPPTLSDVVELSTACQLRMDELEATVDEIRKKIQATQRKVYRDVDRTQTAEEQITALVGGPPDVINENQPYIPNGNHTALKTGDCPPDNWR